MEARKGEEGSQWSNEIPGVYETLTPVGAEAVWKGGKGTRLQSTTM